MPRTAALLCVQNSAESLSWWIAHHVAVGFSTLLICDDHSSDGSWDLLSQAAQHYDIRTSRTDSAITDTYERHQSALLSLVQRESDDLEWILPLSVDEYAFPEASSISRMLDTIAQHLGEETFQRTTTLPLNWCLCGLNGIPSLNTIDQPSPRALYTRHAPHGFPDHRITQSFFRPHSRIDALPDPFSRLNTPPDWSFGRILHDAARTSPSPAARRYYDRNDVAYYDGQRFLEASQQNAATLLHTLLLAQTRALRRRTLPAPLPNAPPVPLEQHCIGSLERFLVVDRHTHRIVWRDRALYDEQNDTRLCLASCPVSSSDHTTRLGWLYPENALALPYLPLNAEAQRFGHLLDILPLTLTHHPDGIQLSLPQQPENIIFQGKSLFPLYPLPPSLQPSHQGPFQALEALTRYGLSGTGVQHALQEMAWNAPSALAAVSVHLSAEDASHLLSPLLLHLFHGQPS